MRDDLDPNLIQCFKEETVNFSEQPFASDAIQLIQAQERKFRLLKGCIRLLAIFSLALLVLLLAEPLTWFMRFLGTGLVSVYELITHPIGLIIGVPMALFIHIMTKLGAFRKRKWL